MVGKTILLLENSEDDAFLFQRAVAKLGFAGTLSIVRTVAQGRDYMLGVAEFADRAKFPFPDLVVCDHALDGERGADLVQWLKDEPRFRVVPVVFFSGTVQLEQVPFVVRQFGIPMHRKQGDLAALAEEMRKILRYIGAA